ncbi:MAG: trypsin-like peptidase domain-containing protein [Salaquimonas sp.]
MSVQYVRAEERHNNWRVTLVKNRMASVVSVLPQTGNAKRNLEEPEGSGVAIGNYILTADHVLGDTNRVLVRASNGQVSEATIYLRDKMTDLALLKPAVISSAMSLNELTNNVETGGDVCVIGNAFGLGPALTCGIVSAMGQRGIGFNYIEDFIQTDAAVNPGMSGAPLFNDQAELVGLVTAIYTKKSDGNLGVNFAASANLIKVFLEDAIDGKIDRQKPGVIMQNAPLPGETGPAGGLVKAVASNSPEDRSGVMVKDLVLSANDIPIKGQADYLAALALSGVSGQMRLEILRDGQAQIIEYSF